MATKGWIRAEGTTLPRTRSKTFLNGSGVASASGIPPASGDRAVGPVSENEISAA